jgi:serine O-acetyltransferase
LGTTLGKVGAPRIGDDAFIAVGAKILGPVNIGTGARIGANAVVLRDVPAGAVAVGVPAKVVRYVNDPPTAKGT